jgi:hypothetical protein
MRPIRVGTSPCLPPRDHPNDITIPSAQTPDTRTPGKITVQAVADGLKAATVAEIDVVPVKP